MYHLRNRAQVSGTIYIPWYFKRGGQSVLNTKKTPGAEVI